MTIPPYGRTVKARQARRVTAWRSALGRWWSATQFGSSELAAYARPHMLRETRRGIALLSMATLAFLLMSTLFSMALDLGPAYTYTYLLLAALALHVRVSARSVTQLPALNLLGMLLLIVCGSSLVLLARDSGRLHQILLLNVAVLFMLVPMVPWGLREATATGGAIYLMFTSLSFFSRSHFAPLELWGLQFLMLFAGLATSILVTRALGLRKHDLAMRFDLERAHREMAALAHRDPLTGTWNRRHLEHDFGRAMAACQRSGHTAHFGVFDIDAFKLLNDSHGHASGDAVLRAIARAFDTLCGDNEYLVRLGGDEFAFLICGDNVPLRLDAMLDALATEVAADASLALPATPKLSFGIIALPPGISLTLAQAYNQADALLYLAKRAGGNGVRRGIGVATPDADAHTAEAAA